MRKTVFRGRIHSSRFSASPLPLAFSSFPEGSIRNPKEGFPPVEQRDVTIDYRFAVRRQDEEDSRARFLGYQRRRKKERKTGLSFSSLVRLRKFAAESR